MFFTVDEFYVHHSTSFSRESSPQRTRETEGGGGDRPRLLTPSDHFWAQVVLVQHACSMSPAFDDAALSINSYLQAFNRSTCVLHVLKKLRANRHLNRSHLKRYVRSSEETDRGSSTARNAVSER